MSVLRLVCLLALTSVGCSPRQIATSPYPFWGEAVRLDAKDGTSRSLQILMPISNDTVKGCLLIVHGMNEHIGRYGNIARHFADRFIVAGIDLTAHGMSNTVLSTANRNIVNGASGYDVSDAFLEQAQLDNLNPMHEDLKQALAFLAGRCESPSDHKPLPVFILSHSLGSLVTSNYLVQAKPNSLKMRIDGIILSAPAFSVTEVPGWRGWFENPMVRFTFYTHENYLHPEGSPEPANWFDRLIALVSVPPQDGLIELLSMPGFRKMFSPGAPPWVKDYLTDSEEEKIRSANDKYMMKRSVLRFVLASEKEIIDFRSRMRKFDVPYLLIYSENDAITPAWGNLDFIAATRKNNLHNRVIRLVGIPYHEQLFTSQPIRNRIMRHIDDWLQERLH